MLDVLFVCYGNICRSPMAEALLRARLRDLLGPDHGVSVASAGVGAVEGARATREARQAMAARRIDMDDHRATRVDATLARRSARIYCMEPGQVAELRSLAPEATVELLAGGVEDPIGCGSWVYEAVAHKLEREIERIADEIVAERRGLSREPERAPADTWTQAASEPVADAPDLAAGPAEEGAPRMRIAIGSDHAGFRYKEQFRAHLEKLGFAVDDLGVESDETPADYTVISAAVARAVADGRADRGVIVAGSGNGEAIVANKIRGVRATVCNDLYTAEMARRHNDANVLCVGQRVCGEPVALKVLDIWLETEFEGGRHASRIANIHAIEDEERAPGRPARP